MIFTRTAAEEAIRQVMPLFNARWTELMGPYLGGDNQVLHADLAASAVMALMDGFCEAEEDLQLLSGMFTTFGRRVVMGSDDTRSHPLLGFWTPWSLYDAASRLVLLGATLGASAPNPPVFHGLEFQAINGKLVNAVISATFGAAPHPVDVQFLFGAAPVSGAKLDRKVFKASFLEDLGERAYVLSYPDSVADQTVYGAAVDPKSLSLGAAPDGVTLQ